jgi:hypothetical protein
MAEIILVTRIGKRGVVPNLSVAGSTGRYRTAFRQF